MSGDGSRNGDHSWEAAQRLAEHAVSKLQGLSLTDREVLRDIVEAKLRNHWAKLQDLDDDGRNAYAFRVARNAASDSAKRAPAAAPLLDDGSQKIDLRIDDGARTREQEVEDRDCVQWVARKLAEWLEKGDEHTERDITAWKLYVIGRHFEGGTVEPMTTGEIALLLGVSTGEVRRAVTRVSARLACEMGEDPPPPRRPGPRRSRKEDEDR